MSDQQNYRLSPSGLKARQSCDKCFWLYNNKDIKGKFSVFPSLPNGIDRCLRDYFDGYATNGEVPPEVLSLGDDVRPLSDRDLFKRWGDRNFGGKKKGGIVWTLDSGDEFWGEVDNVLEVDGKLFVLDYKTKGNQPTKRDIYPFYINQLSSYSLMMEKLGFPVADQAAFLFYYPKAIHKHGRVTFGRELFTIDLDRSRVEDMLHDTLAMLRGPIPEPNPKCGDCNWAKAVREYEER